MRNGEETTYRTRGGADGELEQLLDENLDATRTLDACEVRVLP